MSGKYKNIPFGIGCFHFRYNGQSSTTLTSQQYLNDLQQTLQSSSSITNIVLENDPTEIFTNIEIDKNEVIPSIRERGGPVPGFMADSLQFDIFIPLRFQEQVAKNAVFVQANKAEKFRVTIRSAFHMAVTFVEPLGVDLYMSGSDTIIIVREFLSKELGAAKNPKYSFEFIGPSPFHVDCELLGSHNTLHDEVNEPSFDCERIIGSYDRLQFRYNIAAFDTIEQAKDALFEKLSQELDLFYYIVQNESAKLLDWVKISNQVQEVIRLYRRKGPLGWLIRVWSASRRIDETFVALAQFEAESISASGDIQSAYRTYQEVSATKFFHVNIERQVIEQQKFPVQQMSSIITMFESRRLKSSEILAVVFGALLGFFGGVAGAIVTRLLTP